MRANRLRKAASLLLLWAVALCAAVPSGAGAAPSPLSSDATRADISSSFGSGAFGRWVTYAIDQHTNPIAAQPLLQGRTDAWNQVGNNHVKVDAHTGGWMQFWNQDRLAQWANAYEPDARHYGGGYGFLRIGGETISTAYDDRGASVQDRRRFGIGYFQRSTVRSGITIDETVYAPFGNDPVVLHDVRIINTSGAALPAAWSEYWDVNPVVLHNPDEVLHPDRVHRGIGPPRYMASSGTLSVTQHPFAGDTRPLSIFAAAIDAPVDGWTTDLAEFFGDGGRAQPDGVAAATAPSTAAPATANGETGRTAFVLRSNVDLPAHGSVTLRYAYGMAQPGAVAPLVARLRRAPDPLRSSMRSWRRYVPQVSLGRDDAWLNREMQWDAYMVKAASVYDAVCRTHTITQGGYYQYAIGFNEAYRDPLEHMLPMALMDPRLARETIRWALQYQRRGTGDLPYGTAPLCSRSEKLGTADELNFWLFLSVIQYIQQTRDFGFLNERVAYDGGGTGTVWEHLRLAHRNQEQRIGYGAHGLYKPGTQGDTFDLTRFTLGLTESTSTTGNFAYIYPQLAALAAHYGDGAFARALRRDGKRLARALGSQWQARGWYARGFVGARAFGTEAIYADAQYWPLLAGLPDKGQAAKLIGNVQRYLDAFDAPAVLHGPSRVGPTAVPARNDPGVSESTANFPGRESWWFVNAPLVWALIERADDLPGAADYAWSVFRRLTLANHADAYPDQWSGTITTDDTCAGPAATVPGACGLGLSDDYNTQITHAHAWGLFALFKLAGIDGTPRGFAVAPRLPQRAFSVRTKVVGVAYSPSVARGYVRPVRGGKIEMTVRLPRATRHPTVTVAGHRVPFRRRGDDVRFTMHADRHRAVNWWVVAR
jgi:hypothetical protein